MKVTIEEVAKQAGVSKATVSRIMNGKFSHMTEETRNRVQKVIQELDYRPNPLARGLKQMKTNVVGIILSNLKNPFWTRVLEGVEDTCRSSGYSLMICNSNEDPAKEVDLIKGLKMRQVDGIIVNPTVKHMDSFVQMINERFPLVVINRKLPGLEVDSVVVDNLKGARLATEHLLGFEKRRIVTFVYEPNGVTPWQERAEGYREAMASAGLEPLVVEVANVPGAAKSAALAYFRGNAQADAVFSTNNMMTLEIIEALKELELRIPQDIGLIGYDETVWAQHMQPPLTTVLQPAYEMGVIAAKNVIKRIKAKNKTKPKTVVLEPELIVRQSCGSSANDKMNRKERELI